MKALLGELSRYTVSPSVILTRFLFVVIGLFCAFARVHAQPLEHPYLDTGLGDRIVGYANPGIDWDETWPASLADRILQEPRDLNEIYVYMVKDFREGYQAHGLNISPESDGGRFQALQLAINDRVDRHNHSVEVTGAWIIGIGVASGLGVGGALGWARFRRHSWKNRMAAGIIGLSVVGGACGALLGSLTHSLIKNPYPRFDQNNPALVEPWKELEALSTRSPSDP